ncbi:response regulator [Deinococcus depolymerans]|uniref:Response regulator n=1 Tax=Deinococcus depolymerans TaxID=392408 RepID=A0ABN1BNQ6_9DEIO
MPQVITVLLIDDNPADLTLAQEAFDDHSDHVTLITCSEGAQAIRLLKDTSRSLPDVIVLDVNMPVMSGFDVLRTIRADEDLRHLPVVMLSTSSSEADIGQAYDLIASSYMLKNASFSEFVSQIDQFVKFWTGCQFKRPHRP